MKVITLICSDLTAINVPDPLTNDFSFNFQQLSHYSGNACRGKVTSASFVLDDTIMDISSIAIVADNNIARDTTYNVISMSSISYSNSASVTSTGWHVTSSYYPIKFDCNTTSLLGGPFTLRLRQADGRTALPTVITHWTCIVELSMPDL